MSLRRSVLALLVVTQLAWGCWAWGQFPPQDDGVFYEMFARRLAAGQGYTFAWPDGAVTYVAHFPVGYPFLLSLLYRLFGPVAGLGWVLGAGLHLGAALALGWMARQIAGERAGWLACLLYGLHPALFFYTPVFMTEALTSNLLVVAVALLMAAALRSTWPPLLGAGMLLGVATLVRPQSLLFAVGIAAAWAWTARPGTAWRRRWLPAAFLILAPLLVCLPWTLRNCERMDACALVSVNGGWNLLIGTQTRSGAWEALEVPEACREVWDEAGKDRCFGEQAKRAIAAEPWSWLRRAPGKLQASFDYFGAAPYMLHAANPERFGERAKLVLGGAETVVQRLLMIAAAASFLRDAASRRWRGLAWLAGALALLPRTATLGLLLLVALALHELWTSRRAGQPATTLGLAAAVVTVTATAVVHAVFFGGGRYGLPVVPWVVLLASRLAGPRPLEPRGRPA